MCCDCSEIEINTGESGDTGYSPQLAISEACSGKSVLQLISWINGTGQKPLFNSNIMTDAWLLANPIYLGENGFTDDCAEAVDITGVNGTNGTNGTNGSNGEAGNDGCNPNITFNITTGPDKIVCTVDERGTDCAPIFDVNIPNEAFTSDTVINTITSSTTFTNAIDSAVDALVGPTPVVKSTSDGSPLQIGTGSEDIKYYTAGSATLDFDTSLGASYVQYSVVGNKMYLNFRLFLEVTNPGIAPFRIEIKIPGGYTRQNTNDNNSICLRIGGINSPGLISTNSTTSSSYLKLGTWDDTNITLSPGAGPIHAFGQITFTIN